MDFIAGSWADPKSPDGVIEDRSPADLSMLLGRHPWAVSQADAAVAAAREAQPAFAARPTGDREQFVRRIGAVLEDHEEELARAIALDVGKPLWEARTEAQACGA
jgi:succinylglutamic semialdehyde dehydrogenase